jgi:hypothetical protein
MSRSSGPASAASRPRCLQKAGVDDFALIDRAGDVGGVWRDNDYLQREWLVIAFRNPALMRFAERGVRKHLEVQVKDPELRAKLLRDYRLGCKRILISRTSSAQESSRQICVAPPSALRPTWSASPTSRCRPSPGSTGCSAPERRRSSERWSTWRF